MQSALQQRARALRPHGHPFLAGIAGILALVILAAAVVVMYSPSDPVPVVRDSAAPTFPDELAFAKAWYRPYPSVPEVPARPVVAPTASIFDDPIAFQAAWYQPFPAVATPAPSVFDDPFTFEAAWYRPYP